MDEIWAPDILQKINNRQTPVFAQYLLPTPPRPGGQQLSVICQLIVHAADLLEFCPIAMEQSWHYYYFDLTCGKMQNTTKLIKKKNLTTPQELRKNRVIPYIPNGGWHFSYMGGANKIINKVNSIVEGNQFLQLNKNLANPEYIKECMKTGKDIYGRKNVPESQFYPYDVKKINLPYLTEFLKKYPQFLRPKD